jgi:hypothetical protein
VELAHLVLARQLSLTGPKDNARRARAKRALLAALAHPTLHFFVLGLVALVSQRAWTRATAERPSLRVVVPTGLTAAERERRVDIAILIEEGLALGWARTDPVIRSRLVSNLRFARGEALAGAADDAEAGGHVRADGDNNNDNDNDNDDPAAAVAGASSLGPEATALLEEALRLGMQRSDLVVRRRLVSRAERMLTSDVRAAPVDDATLLAYREAHPERFEAPARYRYTDLFLSRQRHGDALPEAAAAMQARLAAGATTPAEAAALSDPLLYTPGDRWVSHVEVERRLGGTLARHLDGAPLGAWAGPFESSFGLHFVWVRERRAAALPSLDVARTRILGAYRDERQEEAVRTRMAELRAQYDVTVVEQEGAP